jgi:DNA-binding transcriptional MerR regulator
VTGAVQRSTRTRRLLSIGEVLAELQPDFADLTHSKLRFLEDRGLVEPERTAAGYRKFSPADVARLRLVLELQRDHYWPLKKIGEYLDQLDRGVAPELPGGSPRPARLLPPSGDDVDGPAPPTRARLRRDELVAAAGIDLALLDSLETYGLVGVGEQGYYDTDDLEVARTAGELAAYGIEPRHLRAFRTAADREVGLVEQVTSPLRHHRGTGSHAKAEELAREVSALCLRLHSTLVRAALDN